MRRKFNRQPWLHPKSQTVTGSSARDHDALCQEYIDTRSDKVTEELSVLSVLSQHDQSSIRPLVDGNELQPGPWLVDIALQRLG